MMLLTKKNTRFLVIIALLAALGNYFLGNPLSKYHAGNVAEQYLHETYQDKDFYIEGITFDSKTRNYIAQIVSPSSIDSHFSVGVSTRGNVLYDLYSNDVLSKYNTISRIQDEYSDLAVPALKPLNLKYNIPVITATISFSCSNEKTEYNTAVNAIPLNEIQVDGFYNIRGLAKQAGLLDIEVAESNVSTEQVAEILIAIKSTMDQAKIPFHAINLYLTNTTPTPANSSAILFEAILYEEINETRLVERIHDFQK